MKTYRFAPAGGTLWDDLEADRPWFDPAIAADRLQDRETAERAAVERFDLVALEAEAGRPAPALVDPDVMVRPGVRSRLEDNDIVKAGRRRDLVEALRPDWSDRIGEFLEYLSRFRRAG